uniref:GON domain-containing protein n=1 Tax=Parastrongyloides trichosuri TaxID=131310 RepID=A0A0N4ZYD6_PARTI
MRYCEDMVNVGCYDDYKVRCYPTSRPRRDYCYTGGSGRRYDVLYEVTEYVKDGYKYRDFRFGSDKEARRFHENPAAFIDEYKRLSSSDGCKCDGRYYVDSYYDKYSYYQPKQYIIYDTSRYSYDPCRRRSHSYDYCGFSSGQRRDGYRYYYDDRYYGDYYRKGYPKDYGTRIYTKDFGGAKTYTRDICATGTCGVCRSCRPYPPASHALCNYCD